MLESQAFRIKRTEEEEKRKEQGGKGEGEGDRTEGSEKNIKKKK